MMALGVVTKGNAVPLTASSICRVCQNLCSVQVEIDGGRAVGVQGDSDNPIYNGYTCVKGRNHWALYDDPQRLLHSLKRTPDGEFIRIPTEDAIAEIAERITTIRDLHGPRSIGLFWGTYYALENAINMSMADAFMKALGSPMIFSPNSMDQPGKVLAKGLHGAWMAPGFGVHDPDVALIIGNNPMVSHQGRNGHPGTFVKDLKKRGATLIVIDPRKTELAKRANHYLQCRPGEDAPILAGLIRVIIEEELYDAEFLAEHVAGFEALRAAVAPFTPALVAERAGIDPDALVSVARVFAGARRAYALAGTGPNMSGHGTLTEYLILCLDTLCGHWMREGERIRNAVSLVPTFVQMAKAQALPPFPSFGYGERARVRGLGNTIAGMPTGALPDEMLLPGEGRVRALISLGGNPASSVPDTSKMFEALGSLDLLVQSDIQMSTTARMADYVIPAKLAFEMASTNQILDFLSLYANGWGLPESFAQYAPAIIDPPDGSDVIAPWRLVYRLAQQLKLDLQLFPGPGDLMPGGVATALDMSQDYDENALLDMVHMGSRIPLDEVRRHPAGALFPEPAVTVAAKDPGWEGRLDVGNAAMIADLLAFVDAPRAHDDTEFPFRLLSRRMMHITNTPTFAIPKNRPPHNPAYLNPADLERLDVEAGDIIEIASARDTILAVAEADPTVRPATVSISHSFGGLPDDGEDVRTVGSHTGRLIANDIAYDRYSGQPRMSGVPVRISHRAD